MAQEKTKQTLYLKYFVEKTYDFSSTKCFKIKHTYI